MTDNKLIDKLDNDNIPVFSVSDITQEITGLLETKYSYVKIKGEISGETGNKYATRARFKDSVDFIGWYVNKTHKLLKIPKNDAYRQYLAYYKGWGDYKNYSKDKKAIIYAKSVKETANLYRKQLTLCQKNLNKNKYIIF